MMSALGWFAVAFGAGLLTALLGRHPRRQFGLIPVGATLFAVGTLLAAVTGLDSWKLASAVGGGMAVIPAARLVAGTPERGMGWTRRPLPACLAALCLTAAVTALCSLSLEAPVLLAFAAVGVAVAGAAWVRYFRHALELFLEVLAWPIYRIRGSGPGLAGFPRSGPVVIVANHSAWMDPIWLGKVLPRRLIPMMGSRFYDLPVLEWLMRVLVQAIRVEQGRVRRDFPEIEEAVAVLDRGGCLLIFPEGGMRRTAEQPLRRFGQGVARILVSRPQVPVVCCWIEGGWGSFFSYYKGPPTKNKRMDFWRRIRIGIGEPEILSPALLDNHFAVRRHLMERCLAARDHLGLGPLEISRPTMDVEPNPAAAGDGLHDSRTHPRSQ